VQGGSYEGRVCDEIGRAIGRTGGLLRGKEFDVIALSFPRELENSARPEAGWPTKETDSSYETVSFSGSFLAAGETCAPSRKIEGIRGDLSGIAHVRERFRSRYSR